MNMISTGTFLNEMDASNKQSALVKKLVAAWEKKNTKAARAGGMSLMALSLAACGDDDTTPFAQSDIDAATAPLTAAVAAAETALAAAQADAAAALVAQAAAETQAAEALVAQAAAEASAAAATVSAAEATVALAAAEAAQAAAETALATANAEKATLQASYDSLVASNTTLQASYDALVAPKALALTAAATDNLIGGAGNDTFTGAGNAIDAADVITDQSTTDADVLTLNADANSLADPGAGALNGVQTVAGGAMSITNVETINLEIASLTANVGVDTNGISGNSALNISRVDPVVAGATLNSGGQLTIENINGANTPTISITGSEVTRADAVFEAATQDGATLNFDTVTTTVNMTDGAGTLNAAAATGTVTADDQAGVVNATAVTVNAAGAATVNVGAAQAYDGNLTVNAAAATTVRVDTTAGVYSVNAPATTSMTVDDADGGGSITASTTSAADSTITVSEIDVTGFTINTGTGSTTASAKQITLELEGTAAATDTVSISGTGSITVDINNGGQIVDVVNMSGAAGAVTYILEDAADVLTSGSVTGSNNVSISSDSQSMSGSSVTGLTGLTLTANSNANNTIDLDSVTDVAIVVTADMDADGAGDDILRLDAGSSIEFQNNQTITTVQLDTATSDLSLTSGDVNGTSTTVGTLNLGTELITSQATANSATTGNTTGGTVTITANESNLTVAGVTAWSQNMVLTGDENVTLSTAGASTSVKAQSLNAGALTGNLTINVEDTVGNTADVSSVTGGSGTDNITMDVGTAVVTVDGGGGNDTIVVTDTGATSTFAGNEGDDGFTMTEAATAYVVVGGTGNDTFNVGTNTGMQATIVGGAGTDDTLIVGNASLDLTASSANFGISGVEVFELDATNGTMTMTSTQFAGNNTVKLEGAGGDDVFIVEGLATGVTIDASALTVEATQNVTITYQGGTKNDTITGGDANETLDFGSTAGGAGGVDTYDGGAGTDTFDGADVRGVTETGSAASQGAVINLGTTAVSATDVNANIGTFVSGNLTSVASGGVAYTFTANSTANSANVSTLSNIENITGTAGADYMVGDAGANVITSGNGLDYLTGGLGEDDFISTAAAAGNGAVISDFTSATDDFDYNGTVLNGGVSTIVATAGATLTAAVTAATNTAFVINLAANNAGLTTAVTAYLANKTTANADAVEAAAITAVGTDANLDTDITAGESVIIAVDNLVSGTGESTVFRFANTTTGGGTANTIEAGELTLLATLGATDLVAGDII